MHIADSRFRGKTSLTYSYDDQLAAGHIVTVPIQNRMASGFILGEVDKPSFGTKVIKNIISSSTLPQHCIELAKWLKDYYFCSLGEALRQFAPTTPIIRSKLLVQSIASQEIELKLDLKQPLTDDQKKAISFIESSKSVTTLLHGETATGKTRVYLELAKKTLQTSRSVIMLTPEIALTSQLAFIFSSQLKHKVFILHSQLTAARRKQLWKDVLESKEPIVVIGPRSALFSPMRDPGLIILDEAHEPAYKQEQSPRYHTGRVASQLGLLTDAKVILGTATPSVVDYYLAEKHGAVVRMSQPAIKNAKLPASEIIDIKDRSNFKNSLQLSDKLIGGINTTILAKKQVVIYLNRRGTARLILCNKCGWQSLCPNCDIPLVYHADEHLIRCHVCGYKNSPPINCPTCGNVDIIYKGIGTKALLGELAKLFPNASLQRFDSDNVSGERIHEVYHRLHKGEIDILVGTQVLAKGFDLPKLGLVGVISAETSQALPDYSSEERSFQLLYQVLGRVGRGHSEGRIIVQTYNPGSEVINAAVKRDYIGFYRYTLKLRQDFRFPPFAYLLKLTCRRATYNGAEKAAANLAKELSKQKLPVEIVGPTPAFYTRKGRYYYWQLVVKSKDRSNLLKLAGIVPANWMVDLDPIDLL